MLPPRYDQMPHLLTARDMRGTNEMCALFKQAPFLKNALDKNINRPSVVKGKRSRPQKRKIPPATLEELSLLLDTLLEHSKAVGLSGTEKYHTKYTVYSPTLPQSLAFLHNKGTQFLGLTVLQLHCVKCLNAATVTEEQAEATEGHTRLQHKKLVSMVCRKNHSFGDARCICHKFGNTSPKCC